MTRAPNIVAALCLIAGLCFVAGVDRVIPIWSILTIVAGMLQIGRRRFIPAMSRIRRSSRQSVRAAKP